MEWMLIVGCAVWIIGLAFFAPDLLVPRCPICGEILERKPVEDSSSWNEWNLGWLRYSCRRCMYFHRRPIIYRDSKEIKYDVGTLR